MPVIYSDTDYVVTARPTVYRRARCMVVGPIDVPEPDVPPSEDDPHCEAAWRVWRRRMVRASRDVARDALYRAGMLDQESGKLPLDREGWEFMLDGEHDIHVKIKE